jgi:hypothetical protein
MNLCALLSGLDEKMSQISCISLRGNLVINRISDFDPCSASARIEIARWVQQKNREAAASL